jgi:hypothetical protein
MLAWSTILAVMGSQASVRPSARNPFPQSPSQTRSIPPRGVEPYGHVRELGKRCHFCPFSGQSNLLSNDISVDSDRLQMLSQRSGEQVGPKFGGVRIHDDNPSGSATRGCGSLQYASVAVIPCSYADVVRLHI